MISLLKSYFLLHILFIYVECKIPTLTVNKVNQKLVARKRQDTFELCRMFNVENGKIDSLTHSTHTRSKRSAPSLDNAERRVESIIDKLYDEAEEKGEKVTYRQKILPKTISGRRFDFAPSFLEGPGKTEKLREKMREGDAKIPWHKQWKHGIVPYFIDPKTYDSILAEKITRTFDYFEQNTCIRLQRLRERPTDHLSLSKVEWLYITNPSGTKQCVHSNEYKPNIGVQMVVFGYDCMSQGEIVHEIMHVLGFSHEHIREDRDHHISVLWDNIKPGYKKYFETKTGFLGLPYDYASVLHYPARAFSKNGKYTLMASPGVKFGQRDGLSELDVEKVSMIFGNECMNRNKNYLLTTCPAVITANRETKNISQEEVVNYFKDRLWPYGIINYRLKDKIEFSIEERENIDAVIKHIEKETCIEFRNLSVDEEEVSTQTPNEDDDDEGYDQNGEDAQVNDDDNEIDPNNVPNTTGQPDENTVKGSETFVENKENARTGGKKKTVKKVDDTRRNRNKNATAANADKSRRAKFRIKFSPKKEVTHDWFQPTMLIPLDAKPVRERRRRSVMPLSPADVLVNTERNAQNDSKNVTAVNADNSSGVEFTNKVSPKEVVTEDWGQQTVVTPLDAKPDRRRRRRSVMPLSPARRHADDVLVLTRSPEPGCHCPKPGRPNTETELVINADCFNSVNDLLHLFVHVLGLDHQHNMHDRDEYLFINWTIASEELKKEMTTKLPMAASVGFSYDYQSVMHYPWLHIKNGVTSVVYPIWNDGWSMGHWQGLSSTDVQKLNVLYYHPCMARKNHVAMKMKRKRH